MCTPPVAAVLSRIELISVDDLKHYERLLRQHPKSQIKKIAGSIKEFGFMVPIVINPENEIVAGEARYLAAREIDLRTVPCVRADHLSPEQLRAFRIADNKLAEASTWDDEALLLELKALSDLDVDLDFTGFDAPEIDELLADLDRIDGLTDPDHIPVVVDPVSRPGMIWCCGNHRVMCGDATSRPDVESLMSGSLAGMVFTDPPYNVDYTGTSGNQKMKIENDNLSAEKFYQLLFSAFKNMIDFTVDGGAIYICHADSEWHAFRTAMVNAGWLLKQCLVWVKNSFVLGRQDYHYRHEPILYGWKPGAAHRWFGGRRHSTVMEDLRFMAVDQLESGEQQITFTNDTSCLVLKVPGFEVLYAGDDVLSSAWSVQRPVRNADHPTIKPVRLVERAIRNSSRKGDVVIDLFGGGGTTLIACEQRGRHARIMELDPRYCDVNVRRWEAFTGRTAEILQ